MLITCFNDHKKEMIQIIVKAWADEVFKQRLIQYPEEVFKEFGIFLDKNLKVHFHFCTQEHFYLNLPLKPQGEELSEEELKFIAGGLSTGEYWGLVGGCTAASAITGAAFA